MKKIYAFILIPTAFFVALLLFPASMNKSEIVDGYRSTVQFSSSNMAYSFYLSQFDDVTNNAADIGYAESVRDRIVSLAVSLCEKYGNGGSMQYSPSSLRRQGQFRYSLDMVDGARVGYNTMDDMRNQLKKMSADPSTTGNISCCGFALFCWDTMLSGQSFYGTICSIAVKTHFQDIIEGDGTLAYIKQYAKPGDLLFYTNDTGHIGNPPPLSTSTPGKPYTHVEVYIGSYSGKDAEGTAYTMEHACAGSNEPRVNRDACIKPLESTVASSSSSHKAIYLVSLDKWIACGYTPSDIGTTPDILTYAQECPP